MEFFTTTVIGTILVGLFTNRTDHWLCKAGDHILNNLRSESGDPAVNHDIQRAVRRAYLRSTLSATEYLLKSEHHTNEVKGQLRANLKGVKRYLSEQIKATDTKDAVLPQDPLSPKYRWIRTPNGSGLTEADRRQMIADLQ